MQSDLFISNHPTTLLEMTLKMLAKFWKPTMNTQKCEWVPIIKKKE